TFRQNRIKPVYAWVSVLVAGGQQVIDRGVAAEFVVVGDGVVFHTGELYGGKPGLTGRGGKFAGLDEVFVAVSALWQHAQQVFRANNGKQERLGVAVERREKDPAA